MTMISDLLKIGAPYIKPKARTSFNDWALSSFQCQLCCGVVLCLSMLSGLSTWYSSIECTECDLTNVNLKVLQQWCYANSTFIVESPQPTTHDLPVGTHSQPNNKVVHLKYYQWVTMVLFLQAAAFQIPRCVWKLFERGHTRNVVSTLDNVAFADEDIRKANLKRAANYFKKLDTVYEGLYVRFALCQFLYLVNAIAQIVFTDAFLNGQFVTLLPKWVAGEPELERVFPKRAKCNFSTYGLSGGAQTCDTICVLPMNILLEKLYLLLWGLLFASLVVAILQSIYTVVYFVSARLRAVQIYGAAQADELGEEALLTNDCDRYLMLSFLKWGLCGSLFSEFIEKIQPVQAGEQPGGGTAETRV